MLFFLACNASQKEMDIMLHFSLDSERQAHFLHMMQGWAGKFKLAETSELQGESNLLPLAQRGQLSSPQSGFRHLHGVVRSIGIKGLKFLLRDSQCLYWLWLSREQRIAWLNIHSILLHYPPRSLSYSLRHQDRVDDWLIFKSIDSWHRKKAISWFQKRNDDTSLYL